VTYHLRNSSPPTGLSTSATKSAGLKRSIASRYGFARLATHSCSTRESSATRGSPLHWDFEPFDLPPIDRVDWHEGLAKRFEMAGLQIDAAQLDQILTATGNHPLRTMSVAKEALRETRRSREARVGWGAVDAAIAAARRHPSWRP